MGEEEDAAQMERGLAALGEMRDSALVMTRAAGAAIKGLADVARFASEQGQPEIAQMALEHAKAALAQAQEAR